MLLKTALTGTVLNNDMNNGIIKNAQTLDFRASTYNLGTCSDFLDIDRTLGDVQYGVLAGDTTLMFSKWAPAGTQSSVQVMLTVTPGQTILLPASVNIGTETIEGYSSNSITVPTGVEFLHYEFSTIDCGTNIEIIPVNRPRVTDTSKLPVGTPAPKGAPGDVEGDVKVDSSQIWYCTAPYDGTTTIWSSTSNITSVNVSDIQNGTSNVRVLANGNVTMGIAGNANILVVSATGITASNITTNGSITASGNVTVGNLSVTGASTITGNTILNGNTVITGNANIGGAVVIDGNVTSGNVTSTSITSSGNITSANLSTGNITTTGNSVTGGSAAISGNAKIGRAHV